MKRSLLVVALCACAFGAQAEVYKWIDADGKVQYGDAPPKNAKAKVVSGGVTVVPASVAPPAPAASQPAAEGARPANPASPSGPSNSANSSARPEGSPAPASPPADPAIAEREAARLRAIERCKTSRGVDCESEVDAQLYGQPGQTYAPGVVPGWSQPPIRPSQRPPSQRPDSRPRPTTKPRAPEVKEMTPPAWMRERDAQSSAPAKPAR